MLSLGLSLAASLFVLSAPDVPRAVSGFGSRDNNFISRAEYAFTSHAPALAAAATSSAVPGAVPTAAVRGTVRAVWATVWPAVRVAAAALPARGVGRFRYEGGVGAGSHPATTAAILPAAATTTTAAPATAAAPTTTAALATAPATASPLVAAR